MKLVHLRRESKKDDKSDSVALDGDKYPHGTKIHMDHETLEKLGVKDTPRPGDEYHIQGRAKVTEAHESADGKKEGRRVSLHFTHMGAEPKSDGRTLRSDIEKAHDNAGNKIAKGKEERVAKKANQGKDAQKGTEKPGVG